MTINELRKKVQGVLSIAQKLDDYEIKVNIAPILTVGIKESESTESFIYFSCSDTHALLDFEYDGFTYFISINEEKKKELSNLHVRDNNGKARAIPIEMEKSLEAFNKIYDALFDELYPLD